MDTDELYNQASTTCGAAIRRLARGYEDDPDRRRDLLHEIHIELWRSFRLFDGQCSLRTWVYRVAHNVAASHIMRGRRASRGLVDLETLNTEPGFVDGEAQANLQCSVSRLFDRIYSLKPLDRQIMLLTSRVKRLNQLLKSSASRQPMSRPRFTGSNAYSVENRAKERSMQQDNQETFYEKLWKSQEEEPMKLTNEEICVKARRREKLSVRSYWILCGVTVLFLAAFIRNLLQFREPWLIAGTAWILAELGLFAWRLLRSGPARIAPAEPCADFLRRELQGKRQGCYGSAGEASCYFPPPWQCNWARSHAFRKAVWNSIPALAEFSPGTLVVDYGCIDARVCLVRLFEGSAKGRHRDQEGGQLDWKQFASCRTRGSLAGFARWNRQTTKLKQWS